MQAYHPIGLYPSSFHSLHALLMCSINFLFTCVLSLMPHHARSLAGRPPPSCTGPQQGGGQDRGGRARTGRFAGRGHAPHRVQAPRAPAQAAGAGVWRAAGAAVGRHFPTPTPPATARWPAHGRGRGGCRQPAHGLLNSTWILEGHGAHGQRTSTYIHAAMIGRMQLRNGCSSRC